MEKLLLSPLINAADIRVFAQVAVNVNEETMLQPYIIEAQNMDVRGALGSVFWTDILKNQNDEKYKILLEGGTYQDSDENDIAFLGLNAAIACFAYSRYVIGKRGVDTPFGFQQQSSEYTNRTESRTIQEISSQKRAVGQQYLEDCLSYLREKSDEFELFEKDSKGRNDEPYGKGSVKIREASRI